MGTCGVDFRYGCRCGAFAFRSITTMDLAKVRSYYNTDFRLGIVGLAAVETQQYDGQLNEESLFLFCGRRADQIKPLY